MACISLPTAMLIGGAITGVAGLGSALIGSNAAQQAAKQQADALKTATSGATATFNANKSILSPFISAGTNIGEKGIENLLNGDPSKISAYLEKLPGYKFTLDQGLKSVQNGFAAQGLGSSGAAMRGGADYAAGLASQTYQSLFKNFLDTAQLGEQAGSSLAGVSTQLQGDINNLIGSTGTALASGTVGSANALSGGLTTVAGGLNNSLLTLGLNGSGFFGNSNTLNSAFPSGGGGGGGF